MLATLDYSTAEFASSLPHNYSETIRNLGFLVPGTSTELQFQSDLIRLSKIYKLDGQNEIIEYLSNSKFLVPILFQAVTQINRWFPGDELSLQVARDPEYNHSQLVVSIRTAHDATLALEHLNHLDFDWWLKTPLAVRERTLISLEFL